MTRFDRAAEALLRKWITQFGDGVGTYGGLRRLISTALREEWSAGLAAGTRDELADQLAERVELAAEVERLKKFVDEIAGHVVQFLDPDFREVEDPPRGVHGEVEGDRKALAESDEEECR